MTKKLVIGVGLLLLPAVASADSVGGCGFGSKIFDGKSGVAPQVMAVTTNGFYGTQTFGISSGTLGCEQNGVVRSNWKTAMLIDSNMNKFARDVSAGEGEVLDSLATLLEIEAGDRVAFNQLLKENFEVLFPGSETDSEQVVTSLRGILAADSQFSRYSSKV